LSVKSHGSAWHKAQAATHGRRARAILLDYTEEAVPQGCAVRYIEDEIVEQAITAVHHANLAIEVRERAEAPVRQILANAEEQRLRQMFTPRCDYRHVSEERLKDGSTQKVAGDPCGGKLKPVTRRRVLTGGECVTCGRFYPVPKEPEAAAADAVEAEDAA
jgi:hypothetical protein